MKSFAKNSKKSVKIETKRKIVTEKRTSLFITYLFCSNATKTKRNLTSADLTENRKRKEKKQQKIRQMESFIS